MTTNKEKRSWLFSMVLSMVLTFGLLAGGCGHGTPGGNEDGLLIKTKAAAVYDSTEAVYTGGITELKGQYANVSGGYADSQYLSAAIAGGMVTITLPQTPPDMAQINGSALSSEGSGIKIAHYSFEGIGIGKTYAGATHLDLYWAQEAIAGTYPLPKGWSWVDGDNKTYISLQAALDAGNKLYTGALITYTAEQNGGASGTSSSTALDLTFDNDVADLTEDAIFIFADTGAASAGEISGSAKAWKIDITSNAGGTVLVTIDKWGISRKAVATTVYYVPLMAYGDKASWMSSVPSAKSLKDMAIPGTHDSATWKMTTGETKCQYSSKDIAQQLNDGIRALDIRVGHNGYLYHGDFYTGVHLNDVIDACIDHLKAHKTETILVMLSWEGVGEPTYHLSDYQSWCNSAFTGSRADYWHLSSVIPVLGDVRGKMVLINGDNTGKPGLALGSFIRQNDWDVGHWYQTPNDRANQKYDLIVDFNNRTKAGGNGTSAMLMNCWNKQFNFGVSVEWYADKINGWMWSDKWGTCNYPRGIQSMDFYRGENVNYIINSSVNY